MWECGNTIMSKLAKAFAVCIIGSSSIALVAAAPPEDQNGDGFVTRAEAQVKPVSVASDMPYVVRSYEALTERAELPETQTALSTRELIAQRMGVQGQ